MIDQALSHFTLCQHEQPGQTAYKERTRVEHKKRLGPKPFHSVSFLQEQLKLYTTLEADFEIAVVNSRETKNTSNRQGPEEGGFLGNSN